LAQLKRRCKFLGEIFFESERTARIHLNNADPTGYLQPSVMKYLRLIDSLKVEIENAKHLKEQAINILKSTNRCEEHEIEIELLKRQLNDNLFQLHNENEELNNRLRVQRDEYEAKVSELEEMLKRTDGSVGDQVDELLKMEDRHRIEVHEMDTKLELQIEENRDMEEKHGFELAQKQEMIDTLTRRLGKQEALNLELSKKLSEAQAKIDADMKARAFIASNSIHGENTQLIKGRVDELAYQSLEAQNEGLKSELANLKQESVRLLNDSDVRFRGLMTQYDEKVEQAKGLSHDLTILRNAAGKLEIENEELKKNLELLSEQLTGLKPEVLALRTENIRLSADFKTQAQEGRQLLRDLESQKQEIENVKKKHSEQIEKEVEREKKNMEGEIKMLKEENETLRSELRSKLAEGHQMQVPTFGDVQRQQLSKKIEDLEQERRNLIQEREILQNSGDKLERQAQEFKATAEQLTRNISSMNQEWEVKESSYKAELRQASRSLEDAKQMARALEHDNMAHVSDIASLKRQLFIQQQQASFHQLPAPQSTTSNPQVTPHQQPLTTPQAIQQQQQNPYYQQPARGQGAIPPIHPSPYHPYR